MPSRSTATSRQVSCGCIPATVTSSALPSSTGVAVTTARTAPADAVTVWSVDPVAQTVTPTPEHGEDRRRDQDQRAGPQARRGVAAAADIRANSSGDGVTAAGVRSAGSHAVQQRGQRGELGHSAAHAGHRRRCSSTRRRSPGSSAPST